MFAHFTAIVDNLKTFLAIFKDYMKCHRKIVNAVRGKINGESFAISLYTGMSDNSRGNLLYIVFAHAICATS